MGSLGRALLWIPAAIVLLVIGSEVRPWLDGESFAVTPPATLWSKVELRTLDAQLFFSGNAPFAKGMECFRDSDYDCAEVMFNRHLAANPRDGRALGYLARAQRRLEKYPDNVANSEKAFALGEANFELFHAYAESLEQVGRGADAIKWNYRALGISPNAYEAYNALVRQLMTNGKPDEALGLASAYDAALERRGRRKVFAAQRILIEEMLAKDAKTPRRGKAELRLARLENHFFAPVKLGEAHYISFMVDTGASLTTMSQELFDLAKMPATTLDRNFQLRTADGRQIKGTKVRLPEIRVGQVALRGVEAFICDTCQLLLGQTTLQNFNLQQLRNEGAEYLILTER
jgi:clan AA aspartic protease (TIGR02281 family)